MPTRQKPTRRDMLLVIGRLQDLIGNALAANNDRNPNRLEDTTDALNEAHELCIAARTHDPPLPQKPPNARGWP